MIFDQRSVPAELDGMVAALWYLETPRVRQYEKILPQPLAHFIVNVSAPYRLFDRDGTATTVSDAFVSGMHTDYLVIEAPRLIRHVGASFTPTGLARRTGRAASVFTNRVVDARAVFSDVEPLVTGLRDAPTPADALDRLSAFLISGSPTPADPIADDAATILTERPEVRIRDLVARLGVSHRTAIAHFRASTGLTPKAFAQLVRFHRFVEAVDSGADSEDWAALAAGAGYYDQPHVIRAFRRFTGWTPSEYRALVTEFGSGEALFVPLDEVPRHERGGSVTRADTPRAASPPAPRRPDRST